MENKHTAVTRASFTNQEWFWIVGVHHMAKHLTRKCVTCKKLRNKPLEQLMVLVLLEKQRLKQQRQSMINQLKKNSTACLSYTAWLKLTYVVQSARTKCTYKGFWNGKYQKLFLKFSVSFLKLEMIWKYLSVLVEWVLMPGGGQASSLLMAT